MVKRLAGANRDAAENAKLLLALLKACRTRPVTVIAGGATRGISSGQPWTDPQIELDAFVIYDSPNVDCPADARDLPLPDGFVGRIWILIVLEHALQPAQVMLEIHRVLRPESPVSAEASSMRLVHGFQHDLFRVSHSPHRWLFRGFDELKPGPVGGAGRALNWSVREPVWRLAGTSTACRVTSLCFAWLRLLDGLGSRRLRQNPGFGP